MGLDDQGHSGDDRQGPLTNLNDGDTRTHAQDDTHVLLQPLLYLHLAALRGDQSCQLPQIGAQPADSPPLPNLVCVFLIWTVQNVRTQGGRKGRSEGEERKGERKGQVE